jgi:hypothetical protein
MRLSPLVLASMKKRIASTNKRSRGRDRIYLIEDRAKFGTECAARRGRTCPPPPRGISKDLGFDGSQWWKYKFDQ